MIRTTRMTFSPSTNGADSSTPGNTIDVFPIKSAQATPSEMSILGKWIEKTPGIIVFDYSHIFTIVLFNGT